MRHARMADVHGSVDSLVELIKAATVADGRPVTCRGVGCSACCYEPVLADRREVEHALELLTPEQLQRVKARTRDWLDKVLPSGLLAQAFPKVWDWRPLRAACPLLENGACMVYDRRPAGCRYHMVIGNPDDCFDEEKRRRQVFALCAEVEENYFTAMTKLRGRIELGNLGCLLADLLLHRTVKHAAHKVIEHAQVNAVADTL